MLWSRASYRLMTNNSKNKMFQFDIIINQEYSAWENLSFDIEKVTRETILHALENLLFSLKEGEVSVILANDEMLHHLNKTYRHQDKSTNVLSFGYGKKALDAGILGDIFLSFETVERESIKQKKTFHNHYIHLIIHGILHLLGYDHEYEDDARKMENIEIEILESLNISNPYMAL
jgi:probable rRNA maturation factor